MFTLTTSARATLLSFLVLIHQHIFFPTAAFPCSAQFATANVTQTKPGEVPASFDSGDDKEVILVEFRTANDQSG